MEGVILLWCAYFSLWNYSREGTLNGFLSEYFRAWPDQHSVITEYWKLDKVTVSCFSQNYRQPPHIHNPQQTHQSIRSITNHDQSRIFVSNSSSCWGGVLKLILYDSALNCACFSFILVLNTALVSHIVSKSVVLWMFIPALWDSASVLESKQSLTPSTFGAWNAE